MASISPESKAKIHEIVKASKNKVAAHSKAAGAPTGLALRGSTTPTGETAPKVLENLTADTGPHEDQSKGGLKVERNCRVSTSVDRRQQGYKSMHYLPHMVRLHPTPASHCITSAVSE